MRENSSFPNHPSTMEVFHEASAGGGSGESSVQYIHTDHLTGSNVATGEDAEIVQLLDYYPYGELRIDWKSGSFDEQRKAFGHEYDSDSGLIYMGARYQNPGIGRFYSQDPAHLLLGDEQKFRERYKRTIAMHLANPQSLNSYSYVNNNPLLTIDESGEILPLLAAIGAAAWAGVEISLSAYDVYDTVTTVFGSDASLSDKLISGGGLLAGILFPGGGYGKAGKFANSAFDAAKNSGRIQDISKLPIVKSAQGKLDRVSQITNTPADKLLKDFSEKGTRYVDTRNNNNVNIFIQNPNNSSDFLRLTLDPKQEKIISSGFNSGNQVSNRIKSKDFIKLD